MYAYASMCMWVYMYEYIVLVLIKKTSNQIYFLQNNQTPFDLAVIFRKSAMVSLFVNKYKVDIKQYDQVTKVHSNNNFYIIHSYIEVIYLYLLIIKYNSTALCILVANCW